MATHELKAEKKEMDAILAGDQTMVIRRNANFVPGDFLSIHEFDPRTLHLDGRHVMTRVTHVKTGGEVGGAVLSPNYAALSMKIVGDSEQGIPASPK